MRLAILCCHLVCGSEETKSPSKSYADKKRPKKRKRLGHQMMHERQFENLGSAKLPKHPGKLAFDPIRWAYSTPYQPPAARANVVA